MAVQVRAVLTAVLVLLLTAGVGAGVGAASGRAPDAGAAGAGATVAGVVVPPGFAERVGYEPVLEVFPSGPRLTRPDGGCSSPWGGTAFGFDAACRSHDLGYDLLRDADGSGRPWAGSVRARADLGFAADLGDRCRAVPPRQRAPCLGAAGVYGGAVLANSTAEAFSAPSPQSSARVVLPAAVALLVLGAGTVLVRRGRWPSVRVGAPVLVALLGAAASWQPSALPRTGTTQLLVTAATTLSLLGAGAVAAAVWRLVGGSVLRPLVRPAGAAAVAATVVLGATAGHAGQTGRAAAQQLDTLPLGESLLAGLIGAALALLVAAALAASTRWLGRRVAPRGATRIASGSTVGLGPATGAAVRVRPPARRASAVAVAVTLGLVPLQPAWSADPVRDTGPRLTSFLAGTTTAAEAAAATGSSASAPLRVAVPVTAGDDATRARDAVHQLRRDGGLERGTVLVVLPTGSGWVNPAPVAAAELLTAGDLATVAVQYDDRPSWRSLLTGGGPKAARQTTALLDELERALPDGGSRTRVVLYGESLGAFGGLLAIDHPAVDAAVFAGVPHVASDLVEEPRGRAARRVVGNADDPVTTWSPALAVAPTRGWDGGWLPVVSFWGATGDLLGSLDQPAGHGHRYGAQLVPALADAVGAGGPRGLVRTVGEAVDDGR